MPPAASASPDDLMRRGRKVVLRLPRRSDEAAFLAGVAASRKLHATWVRPPSSPATFRTFVKRYATDPLRDLDHARQVGFVIAERGTNALAGVFNFSEIIHGPLQSAFLGYFAFAGMEGRGFMREGMTLALDQGFGVLGLHRIEVNIQPANTRSLALAEAVGFKQEGYSPRYLKLAGRWRDHLRYALLVEDWRAAKRRRT